MADLAVENRLLSQMQTSLLPDPAQFGGCESDEAIDKHKLLAAAVHRTARLHAKRTDGEARAWVRYFEDYFPEGRNYPADALRAWVEWRTRLLENDAPGRKVEIRAGAPERHWQRDVEDRLCIDLERMCEDFAHSLQQFTNELREDSIRRAVVLRRWKGTKARAVAT